MARTSLPSATPLRMRVTRYLLTCVSVLMLFGLLACEQKATPQCKDNDGCQNGQICLEGICGCPAPSLKCGDQCVDVRSDNAHCGACNTSDKPTACATGKACRQGRCQCPEGQRECPGTDACVDTQTDAKHCGGCGSACADGQFCAKGTCVSKCPDATPTICGQGCIDTNTDSLHCGKCDNKCTNGTSCLKGKCVCDAGQRKCPQGKDKEICVDHLSDKLHCGTCGNACRPSQLCAAGKCLNECPKSTPTICFGGCVDVKSNNEHCGKCGNICEGGKRCVEGVCACLQDKESCAGTCINPRYTRDHCGKCGNKCVEGKVCGDGRCLNSCPRATQTVCFGGCVQLDTNVDHCGKCGNACQPGQVCTKGKCECPTGQTLCNDQCVDLQSNPDHCGKCAQACKDGEVCGQGKCSQTCPSATPENCARACVNFKDNTQHCGACGKTCLPGERCTDGKCGCQGGQIKCNGQCIDTKTSNNHCGTCGNPCQPGTECKAGKCEIICSGSEVVCGATCVDNETNKLHCGSCNNACQGRKTCTKGKCVCPGQLEECDNACINTNTNPKHCGGCNSACSAAERCISGKCELACPQGQIKCGSQCINAQTDTRHCGKCNSKCQPDELCVAGQCECPQGQTLCGGKCVYTSFDTQHCGMCGNACGTGQYCISGACKQCSTNTTPCGTSCCGTGTTCCSGKCVVLTTNPQFCSNTNACGTPCKAGETCCSGVCTDLNSNNQACGACGQACKSGETCCNRTCVADLTSNQQHCGACGNACKSDETCCGGTCTKTNTNQRCGGCNTACKAGETCCTGGGTTQCLDLNSDDKNCGTCGNVCKSNESCCNGTCVDTVANSQACGSCTRSCGTSIPNCCNKSCVNTQSDGNNCGTCGNKCASGLNCCNGGCKNYKTDVTSCGSCGNQCLPGSTCCSGVCADFQRDRINCGKCGTVCPSSEICFKGLCRCVPYYYETCGNNRDDDCDGVKDNPEICTGVTPSSGSYQDYAVFPNGDFITITRTNPVEAVCYKADGSSLKAKFTVAASASGFTQYHTKILTHPNANRVVVMWFQQSRTSPYPKNVFFRIYDRQCNAISTIQSFVPTTNRGSFYSGAMAGNGNFVIAFRTDNTTPALKFYNASGTLLTTANIDGPTRRCTSSNSSLRVTVNTLGNGVVTCHNNNQNTPIYYRRFNSSRAYIDANMVLLSESSNGNAGRSQSHMVGINNAGQFVITWQNHKLGVNQATFFASSGSKVTTVTVSDLVETASGGYSVPAESMPLLGNDFILRDTPNDSRRSKRWYRYSPTGALRSAAAREYNFDGRMTRGNGTDVFVVNYSLNYLLQKLDLGVGKGLCAGKACLCKPNTTILCSNYNFGSRLRNQCHYGTRTCAANGLSFSKCTDFGLPIAEVCGNRQDDDCDGRVDDNCNVPNTHVFPDTPTAYDVAGDGTVFYTKLSGYTLLGYCLRPNGTPLRQPWVISTQSFSSAQLVSAAKGSGKFYVSWVDRSAPNHLNWVRYVQAFDKTCKEIGTPVKVSGYSDYTSYSTMATADNGNGAIAYIDSSRNAYLQFFDDKAALRGAAIKIGTTANCLYRLRVTMNSTTGEGLINCNGSAGVFYQRFNANGTMKDANIVLAAGSATYGAQGFTANAAMNRKGQFVVIWLDRRTRQFKANFYKADGTLARPTVIWSTNGRNFNSLLGNQELIPLLGDDFVLRDGETSNTPTFYRYTPAGVLKSKYTHSNRNISQYFMRSDDTGKHYSIERELLRINPFTLP